MTIFLEKVKLVIRPLVFVFCDVDRVCSCINFGGKSFFLCLFVQRTVFAVVVTGV